MATHLALHSATVLHGATGSTQFHLIPRQLGPIIFRSKTNSNRPSHAMKTYESTSHPRTVRSRLTAKQKSLEPRPSSHAARQTRTINRPASCFSCTFSRCLPRRDAWVFPGGPLPLLMARGHSFHCPIHQSFMTGVPCKPHHPPPSSCPPLLRGTKLWLSINALWTVLYYFWCRTKCSPFILFSSTFSISNLISISRTIPDHPIVSLATPQLTATFYPACFPAKSPSKR